MNPSSASLSNTPIATAHFHPSPLPLAFAYPTSSRFTRRTNPTIPTPCTQKLERVPWISNTKRRRRHQEEKWRQMTRGPNNNRQSTSSRTAIFSSDFDDDLPRLDRYEQIKDDDDDEYEVEGKLDFSPLDSLEELLMELDNAMESLLDDGDDEELDEADFDGEDDDVETLLSLLVGEDDIEDDDDDEEEELDNNPVPWADNLERALMQGVVPVSAGVGSDCLPGDWGFDPLNLAKKDYILQAQFTFLQCMPGAVKEDPPPPRPAALILRDYREAEIRHGRLAMLAAIFWPLQEMLDKLLLDVDQFGPLVYGTVTLPYFPLLMTLIMMLLGYLDIYAKAIQEKDDIGDAFLPGDCFWDPLKILEGAPASMARNMQERELFNGRVAMLAVAAYAFEELTTHLPLISVKGNELLFLPAYQIPYIQEYLDEKFSFYGP